MFTEYERLNRVLAIYRDAMRRHIKQVLDDDPPDVDPNFDWYERKVVPKLSPDQQRFARQDRDRHPVGTDEWLPESSLDIPNFLPVVQGNNGFRTLAEQHYLSVMYDINTVRNRWAHPPALEIRKAEVDRAIHMCADVLNQFDDAAAGELGSLTTISFELDSNQEVLSRLRALEESIEVIRARQVQPEALQNLVTAIDHGAQIDALRQQIERLESAQHTEREAREQQLSNIAETLRLLVEAQQSQRGSVGARLDDLLREDSWTRLADRLRKSLGF